MTMSFFYSQLCVGLPYPEGSYVGKTIIITGSNVGLGKEAARHFVRMGASKMILAVRSMEKGANAKRDIEDTTKCASSVVEVWELDMADYRSVQEFSARADAELDRVDVFIANAGIAPGKYAVAEDNEASITVNVVSTILLAGLMMPKMKSTATKFSTHPTMTIVSSDVHMHTTFPQKSAPDGQIFARVNDKATAEQYWDEQYPLSKLLEIFAVRAIAERDDSSTASVTINTVNPGLCHSELGRDFPTFGFWLIKLVLARSTEVGSRTLVHAASQGGTTHGKYLSDCHVKAPGAFVTSAEGIQAQNRVWDELAKKLEALAPGVTNNF